MFYVIMINITELVTTVNKDWNTLAAKGITKWTVNNCL